jgi:tripartite-type tricarboxylate transporter receptor subunit TctC
VFKGREYVFGKSVSLAVALMVGSISTALAQGGDYYAGKRLDVIVGYKAGGTADADGRIIAQFLGRHIPGHPNLIVQNMPGAGGIKAITLAYNVAKPDGLAIYQLGSGHYLQQLAGSSVVHFDVSKMPVLGAWTRSTYTLVIRADKYKSLEDIRNAKISPAIGTQGIGTGTYLFSVGWQKALGIKLNLITGYESAEQDLAIERMEIDGRTNTTESILRSRPQWLSEKLVNLIAVSGKERDPDVPDVPTVYELNPNPGPFFETIDEGLSVARPYVLPPQTSPELVSTLRKAWNAMLEDQEFIAELKKRKFNFVPTHGEKLEAFYKRVIADTPPDVVQILKENFP